VSGFVHVVRERGLGAAAAVLLHAHGLVVRLAERVDLFHLTEEVHAEQCVERGAAFGRRRQCRMRGAADVGDRSRPEQADRFEERRGLLRRNRKTIEAQQRREGDEGARRTRKDTHAAASERI
jgi:hypothetical protein